MIEKLNRMKEQAIKSMDINTQDAVEIWKLGVNEPFSVMAAASQIREHFKGKKITLCGIVNAKSGKCTENCRFCAQSIHYHTDAPIYGMVTKGEMVEKARRAKEDGVHMFGIITSGTRVDSDAEWAEIFGATRSIGDMGLKPCVSLGLLDDEKAGELKSKGIFRYHHNLETARSFFHNICTTHDYEEDIATVKAAKKAGLSTCSGGIIGLGETMDQRIELAMTLKELDVDSVPVNILNPRPGTPLACVKQLHPLEILMTIAIFRFILPDKDIKLCGGKEVNLRQLLPLGIIAGCNSLMTGDYLTTQGRNTALDIEMLDDLGLDISLETV
ncbi:MAG: biotin synthase BioB [Syntrophorhabdaceae bacterium]